MTREELITKACISSSEFGEETQTEIEVRQSNRLMRFLERCLSEEAFDDLSAVVHSGISYVRVPKNQ